MHLADADRQGRDPGFSPQSAQGLVFEAKDVSINGDDEATFELSEPQPSLPVLLASAFSPVYPCHVPQQLMRTKPIGTGPFKLAEFKRGDIMRLVRNPDYFKKDRPYLDEIAVRTIDSRATRMLAF